MDFNDPQVCQVCFVKPLHLFEYSKILKCSRCKLICHKSCYDPSLKGDKFLCDVCKEGENNELECFICGNQGLLKAVLDRFAHPICLLFSPVVIVTEYKTLQFSIVREQSKKDKKNKCSICRNPGPSQKCFSTCDHHAHMYCIWKDYHKIQVKDQYRGWTHNPVVEDLEYRYFFNKKAKQYLNLNSPTLLTYFELSSHSKPKNRQFELVCPQHTESLFECCTNKKYFRENEDDSPIEYAQCEQCLRWYHRDCLDQKSLQKIINQEEFVCLKCQNFQRFANNPLQEISLNEIPRLNICELIHLQCLFEEKMYKLSPKEQELMFHLPFEPSLIFLEETLKKNICRKLKLNVFEKMCSMNLEFRLDKKKFKNLFSQNIDTALTLLVGKKKLLQMNEETSEEVDVSQKSQQILDKEQRKLLERWIQLLSQFKDKYIQFSRVLTKLIKKLERWLNTLSDEFRPKKQEQIDQIMDESEFDDIEKEKSSTKKQDANSQFTAKIYDSESDQNSFIQEEKLSKANYKYEEEQDGPDALNFNVDQKTFQAKQIPMTIVGQSLELKLFNQMAVIKQKANSPNINLASVYQTLSEKKNNHMVLYLNIILKTNFSSQSAFQLLILSTLNKNFIKIQKNLKSRFTQSHKNQLNAPNIIFKKDLLINDFKKRINFLNLFTEQMTKIYNGSNIQVKKQFQLNFHNLLYSINDMIAKLNQQKTTLESKFDFHQAVAQYAKNPNARIYLLKALKKQTNEQLNSSDLFTLRIFMEKINAQNKIKKVKFTTECQVKMVEQHKEHCQSSSQIMQIESLEGENQQKINLRKQNLAIQQKLLLLWLNMYGLVYNLANDLINLQKAARLRNSLENGQKKDFVQGDKEPLETIEDVLNIDYSTRQKGHKNAVFLFILAFFSKVSKGKINWKMFHESLIRAVQKMGQFCIMHSFENIKLWGQNEQSFAAMKIIYKSFRNSDFITNHEQKKDMFTKIWQIFEADEIFEAYLHENKNNLFSDPQFTEQLFVEKIPEMIKFYNQSGFINRAQKIKMVSVWIACYWRIIMQVGFQRIFGQMYNKSPLRFKYQNRQKTTFNKLHQSVDILRRSRFPQCQFSNKVIQLYTEAQAIDNQVQEYLTKSTKIFEKSQQLKSQFLKCKNIDKDCIENSEEMLSEQSMVSNQELQELIRTLDQNPLSDFIQWNIEKISIMNQKDDFFELVTKIQNLLREADTKIPIRNLNNMFFEVISLPFPYENLSIFYLYIRERVERQKILNTHSSTSKKRKQKTLSVQMIYRNLLESLEPKEKMSFQTRLTRDQITTKFNLVQNHPEFNQVITHPVLKLMRQKIMDQVQTFDVIKEKSQMIVQKINQSTFFNKSDKLLSVKEIQALSQNLSEYKSQKVFELAFELMYSQVEIYKLSLSPIPDSLLDMQVLLEQLKSLKPSFKTIEILRRIKEIEERINHKSAK